MLIRQVEHVHPSSAVTAVTQGEKDTREGAEVDEVNGGKGKDEEADEGEAQPSSKAGMKPSGLTFDHYLGGGAISFSTAMLLMVAVDWVSENSSVAMSVPFRVAVSLVPTLIGAALGAFLFTRRSGRNHLVDGFKIGVFGIVITFLYTMLFRVAVGGVYIILGFLIGGILGGYVAKSI